ncbi:MAG TPA: serine/threonine-protein kinase, partial [Verrucomicrobiae bacterium]
MEKPVTNAEDLFARALDLPPGEARDALIATQCAGDSPLRQEVESLLRAHDQAGDFLPEDSAPRLSGYRIEHKIGEGSLGLVYVAHDEKLNRRVALKVLRHSAGEPLRRRVLNEARKAAALNDPAIVTIFSVLDDATPPAIVMEWVEGFPIDRFSEQLNWHQKASLLREVARGLAAAHARGLIHRDLKPDNILVGPDMRPRILDFGLAMLPGETTGQPGVFAGTPLYASPEQVACQSLAPSSDIFSFGSLMFKVLTGSPPFAGKTVSEVLNSLRSAAPPFLRDVALGVPEDLQAICLACLARDPADRPSASEIVVELGRFLIGEPVRLRPKLYDDLLRRSISEYSAHARTWRSQNIISGEENDALQGLHRRLLADEDNWIIDARRVTLLQTILSGGTWLAVVATILTVWLLRNELGPLTRWLVPVGFTLTLLAAGSAALRKRDDLAAAMFLAGAVLAAAPSCLALLGETGLFKTPATDVTQLFAGVFTNQQVFLASLTAFILSSFALWRLKMTGFAWTTAVLGTTTFLTLLMLLNWLDKKPEVKALWCLPLAGTEFFALHLEKKGRVRWTLPFHVVALLALIVGLDIIALNGPTLQMLGVATPRWPYFDEDRLRAFSAALNGVLFLCLMLTIERSASLDLRRASKLLEILAILHILSALFSNALVHRAGAYVRVDVWIYVAAALMLVALAALRSRWRMLVGGLAGCGLGSYLLVDLGLVARQPFIVGLGLSGLLVALGAFVYVQR